QEAKRTRNITYLSISCAIPITLYSISYAILQNALNGFYTVGATAVGTMSFDVAMANFTNAYIYWVFIGIQYLFLFFAHSTHFYVYYACSAMFNDVARRKIINPLRSKLGLPAVVNEATTTQSGSTRSIRATSIVSHALTRQDIRVSPLPPPE